MQIYVITITRLKRLSLAVSGVCVCAWLRNPVYSPSQCLVDLCLCGEEEGRMGGFRMMTRCSVCSYLMGERKGE